MLWKLLKQHISISQLSGFFFANLCGMVIVLLGVQFYYDVAPIFSGSESFINNDYIVVSKKVSTLGTFVGKDGTFSDGEIDDLSDQPFAKKVGAFQPAQFKVSAGLEFGGMNLSTDMFFESVPDNFVDVKSEDWSFVEGQKEIPIIVPRNYLNLYNFGFAKSRNLPQISEGMAGMVSLKVVVSGRGKRNVFSGRIVGFSNRLNTILVPEKFMNIANRIYGNRKKIQPSRLIVEVDNPADERIVRFLQNNGYETENDKLDAGKTTWFLKMTVGVVLAVGLLISVLSFYILMLSIYLLLQKNTHKLENLRLIGYSSLRVAQPYQALAAILNLIILIFAVIIVHCVRNAYTGILSEMIPGFDGGNSWMVYLVGILLFVFVTIYNIVAVRMKVNDIIG